MKIFFLGGGIFGFNLDAKTRREKKKQFQEIKKFFFYKKRKISFVGVTAAMNILNMTFFGKIASEFFSLEIFLTIFRDGYFAMKTILDWIRGQYYKLVLLANSSGSITHDSCT